MLAVTHVVTQTPCMDHSPRGWVLGTRPLGEQLRKLRGVLETLGAHRQRQLEEREKLANPWRGYKLVFCA